jgi:hypothetical protein
MEEGGGKREEGGGRREEGEGEKERVRARTPACTRASESLERQREVPAF